MLSQIGDPGRQLPRGAHVVKHHDGAGHPALAVVDGCDGIFDGGFHSVAPDQEATFHFTITAPEISGPYEFQWRMVQETVEWFGEASPSVIVTVGRSNNADFVSQTVPTVMLPGDTANVSVTMVNTGASTWDSRENYFLGSGYPENVYTWGLNRVELDAPVPRSASLPVEK